MPRLPHLAIRLRRDRRGVTAIEYAVLAGAVALLVAFIFGGTDADSVAGQLKAKMDELIAAIDTTPGTE